MVMDRLEGSWHWIIAVVVTPALYWFLDMLGGWTPQMRFLTTAIIADMALGILRSIKQRSLSSSVCRDGIIKKGAYFLVVLLAEQVGQGLGQAHTLRDIFVLGFIIVEALSAFENAVAIDVWIPEGWRDYLRSILAQLNSKKAAPDPDGVAPEERLDRYVTRE